MAVRFIGFLKNCKWRGKFRSRSGETLTETLVAVLIIALSIMMLSSMVIASMGINKQARETDKKFYAELDAAESGSYLDADRNAAACPDGKVKLSSPASGPAIEIDVKASGAEGGLTGYGGKP